MSYKKLVIGLMSGTSTDGVDAALVQIESKGKDRNIILKAFISIPYSKKIKARVLKVSEDRKKNSSEVRALDIELGNIFAAAAIQVAKKAKISLKKVHLIGSHGQTIAHLPKKKKTVQIGQGKVIAQKTQVTVVYDFRPSDMAVGGQGAPLAPFFHYHLFKNVGYGVAVQNIGGIGNLTVIPKSGKLKDVRAFDTGPGNMIMDAIISKLTKGKESYDSGGRMAQKGEVHEKFLYGLLSHPFIRKKPPKSAGREEFGVQFAKTIIKKAKKMKKEDLMATVTAFSAYSIAYNLKQFVDQNIKIKEIIVGGGGAKNKMLCYMIQRLLSDIQLKRFEDYNLNSDAVEAMAFALLAYETSLKRPSNIPGVTGAKRAVVLGKLALPRNNKK